MPPDHPRRANLTVQVPAELAIRKAMELVEQMPAHIKLTDAVILLQEALDKVGDFVDAWVKGEK